MKESRQLEPVLFPEAFFAGPLLPRASLRMDLWRHVGYGPRRTLTVTTDGPVVRAVAFVGDQVAEWTAIDLDGPGPYTLSDDFEPYLRRRVRRVSDLPFYALMTRFMPKPPVRKRYLAPVVAAEAATTLPFDPSEVDFKWDEFRDGGGPEVMIAAVPHADVDAHVGLLERIGAKPMAAYAKPLALALAVGHPNVVIAHLDGVTASIVLVRDEVPRAVHRVDLPAPSAGADAYASVIAQGIDELTALERPEADGVGPDALVVLTGTLPAVDGVYRALHRVFGARLRGPSPPIDYPDGFPAAEFAANVGVLIADRASRRRFGRSDLPGGLAIDLLPERHRPRTVSKRTLRLAVTGVLLAAIGLGASALASDARATAATLEEQVAALEREARIGRNQAAVTNRERQQADRVAAITDSLLATEASVLARVEGTLERLRIMTVETPVRRITVAGVDLNAGTVKLSGSAPSLDAVLAYAGALRGSGLFTSVETTQVSSGATVGPQQGSMGALGVAFNLVAAYPAGD